MFELSALLAAPARALQPPADSDPSLLAGLRGREFRFPVPAVPSARLPRDTQSLANLWKSVSSPDADSWGALWPSAVWTALTAPAARIPLVASDGCGQEFAVAAAVETGAGQVMALVRMGVTQRSSKYAQPAVHHASAVVEADLVRMAVRLEEMFLDAVPQARAAAVRGARRAVWLGGDPTVNAEDPAWRSRIEALCAVVGLRAEIVEEPGRRVRSTRAGLAVGPPPECLLVWEPRSRGVEPLAGFYQELTAEGEIVTLAEPAFRDALACARLALSELCLTGSGTVLDGRAAVRISPTAGEERFYIKVGGSKAGVVLVAVNNCGHGQWGSDARRKAPRAAMGVEMLEGIRPRALFRCARCTKHRWRARF
jgi:hypothetical protein